MKKLLLSIFVTICCTILCFAQSPGNSDPSFGNNGIVKTSMGFPCDYSSQATQALVAQDGSMYFILATNGETLVGKKNADGSTDASYGTNGFSDLLSIVSGRAALQRDEKIIVAGVTKSQGDDFHVQKLVITRLNADGSLDKTFGKDGIQKLDFKVAPSSVLVQADKKILVVGYVRAYDTYSYITLIRIDQKGDLDNTFGKEGVVSISIEDEDIPAVVQNDGKIVFVGGSQIMRLTSSGALDSGFNGTGMQHTGFYPSSFAVQDDGKIVVAGSLWNEAGVNEDIAVARYHADGSPDSTFDGDGRQITDFAGSHEAAISVSIQAGGKILLVGNTGIDYNQRTLAIYQYTSGGRLDSSYSDHGRQLIPVSNQHINAAAIENDGKLMATGYTLSGGKANAFTARYSINGNPDNSFDGDGILIISVNMENTHFTATAAQADGKVLAAGYTWNGSNYDFTLVRYNIDGSLDNTFSVDGKVTVDFAFADDKAKKIAIQNDGKIIIVGSSGSHFAMARFNPNGSPDSTFDADGKQTADLNASGESFVAIQSDGKIIGGGSEFLRFGVSGLVKYNTNGTLDTDFGVSGKLAAPVPVSDIALQSDGKIVATGFGIVARYNANGTEDITFGNQNGVKVFFEDDELSFIGRSIAIQNDGKIVAGGYMVYYAKGGPAPDFALIRLNTDGSFDNTFDKDGIMANETGLGSSVKIQSDGKIILAGHSYALNSDDFIIFRYNNDGTLDKSFNHSGIQRTTVSSANDGIEGIAIANNRLRAAGYAEYYGTAGIVAKYFLDANTAPLVKITAPANDTIYSAPATINVNALALDGDGAIGYVKFYNGGKLLSTDSTAPYTCQLMGLQKGNYSIVAKAIDNNGILASSESVAVTVVEAPNKAPVVAITTPKNNDVYDSPATINIEATASDADGTISFVKFYNGGILLATDSASPFTCTMSNVAPGIYNLVAKATDNKGLPGSSAGILVAVSTPNNKAPSVSITGPKNNRVFTSPKTFTVSAVASDADGTVKYVQFFSGTKLLKTDSTSPYNYTAMNVVAGTYSYIAKVTDDKGLSGSSASITVTVLEANKAPGIEITSPANNAIYRASPGILINANALDADGTVKYVQFYSGATLLSTDSASPYTYTATNVFPGNYNYIAKATDNKGLSGSSASIHVTVLANKVPNVNIESYEDTYYAGATVYLSAFASDTDGVIKYVKFYDGATLIKTDSTSSDDYVLEWVNVPAGYHLLTATATDNDGATTTSGVFPITVLPNESPHVKITSPADNSVFTSPAYINIRAAASDADGSIQSVTFYNGTEWITWDDASPYSIDVYYPPGTYSFYATATDNHGATSLSAPAHITVLSPKTLEAEEAVLNGAIEASKHPGFTGSGFADYINPSGDFIEWKVVVADAGSYSLKFRYANGGTTDRPLQLMVNGVVVNENLSFPPTVGWKVWSLSPATVNLVSGVNTVRLTTTGYDGPNVDNLSYSIKSSLPKSPQDARTAPASSSPLQAYVAPNPARDVAKLRLNTSSALPVQLQVVDVLGRTYKKIKVSKADLKTIDIPVNELLPGNYIILLRQGKQSARVRMVVE